MVKSGIEVEVVAVVVFWVIVILENRGDAAVVLMDYHCRRGDTWLTDFLTNNIRSVSI